MLGVWPDGGCPPEGCISGDECETNRSRSPQQHLAIVALFARPEPVGDAEALQSFDTVCVGKPTIVLC